VVQSKAETVEQYFEELPAERREVVAAVRAMILEHLPAGYVETMNWGMIAYEIPLARYPKTYNQRPLGYVALAAQKNYFSLYLMSVYADSQEERALRAAFAAAGKKLDMGKCCVRFKRLEDLELEALGSLIASTTPEHLIQLHEACHRR
jgi:hypothetical protein